MNCRELSEFLSDYVSGELATGVAAEFEGHLGRCPDCLVFVEQYRTTVRLSADAYSDPPPRIPEDLVEAILTALQKSTRVDPA
jgi:predicted anti-sigma-YlaC factor YlaD